MNRKTKLNSFDFLIIAGLVLITVLYAFIYMDFSRPPFEDAAMLMRYSGHIAGGHGIVWNIGEEPVDGGTDFLFMLLVSLLVKAGISLELSVRFIALASHIGTVILVYLVIRKFHALARWIAIICSAYLAIGLGLVYSEAYFGTTFFALTAAVSWYFAIRLARQEGSPLTAFMFALSGLIMGLARPEGVFLALFMLLAVIKTNGWLKSRRVLLYFLGIFAVLGGAYFFWRWNYFGYPLPNPFYKKGGGDIYFSSLYKSIRNVIFLTLPFIWMVILGLRSSKIARQAVFSLIPIAGFTLIWVLLSNEMNYCGRFQYAILPLVLMSWPPLLKGIYKQRNFPLFADSKKRARLSIVILIFMATAAVLTYAHALNSRKFLFHDGKYDMALMLNDYSGKDYTIVTTEAGLLPLYSKWRSIDAWGLNDQWIAHNGAINESYLKINKPHIIMFHAYSFPVAPSSGEKDKWSAMVGTLKSYAEKNGYCLAAIFGDTPYDTHYYYVRDGFSQSAEIIKRIRNIDYAWHMSGKKSINYAMMKKITLQPYSGQASHPSPVTSEKKK